MSLLEWVFQNIWLDYKVLTLVITLPCGLIASTFFFMDIDLIISYDLGFNRFEKFLIIMDIILAVLIWIMMILNIVFSFLFSTQASSLELKPFGLFWIILIINLFVIVFSSHLSKNDI